MSFDETIIHLSNTLHNNILNMNLNDNLSSSSSLLYEEMSKSGSTDVAADLEIIFRKEASNIHQLLATNKNVFLHHFVSMHLKSILYLFFFCSRCF
jgi:hypothetical protein